MFHDEQMEGVPPPSRRNGGGECDRVQRKRKGCESMNAEAIATAIFSLGVERLFDELHAANAAAEGEASARNLRGKAAWKIFQRHFDKVFQRHLKETFSTIATEKKDEELFWS